MDNQRTKKRKGNSMSGENSYCHKGILNALRSKKKCSRNEIVFFNEYYEIKRKVKEITNARLFVTSMENERIGLLLEIN